MLSGREVLLPVALKHFSRHGFEGTSLRIIAEDAGVDMALTARIFGSKPALWNAVLGYLSQKQTKHLQELGSIHKQFDAAPAPALKKFIHHLVLICVDIPEFPSLLLSEAAAAELRFHTLIREIVLPFKQACLPLIEKAIVGGYMRGSDPNMIFAMLISAVSLLVVTPQIAIPSEDSSPPAINEKLIQELSVLMIVAPDQR